MRHRIPGKPAIADRHGNVFNLAAGGVSDPRAFCDLTAAFGIDMRDDPSIR